MGKGPLAKNVHGPPVRLLRRWFREEEGPEEEYLEYKIRRKRKKRNWRRVERTELQRERRLKP